MKTKQAKMSTSTCYNFVTSVSGDQSISENRNENSAPEVACQSQDDSQRQSPSSSTSSSSLNQFNSFASSASNSSSNHSANSYSSQGTRTTYFPSRLPQQTNSKRYMNANSIRNSITSIRSNDALPANLDNHQHPIHSYTLQSLEPKPFKPFKSKCEYLEAMKEDLAEWLGQLYPDLDLTSENFFAQLETGAIICRHANNVTQMGRNFVLDQQKRLIQQQSQNNDSKNSSLLHETNNNFNDDDGICSQSPTNDSDSDSKLSCSTNNSSTNLNSNNFHPLKNGSNKRTIGSINQTKIINDTLMIQRRASSPIAGVNLCPPKLSLDRNAINWLSVKTIPYKQDACPGTFFARDNICQFILWCRSLNILECLLFETDDLVARKNERSFILCLLEVARIGFKVGMPTPLIIQLEQEIDREIENDAKLQEQLERGAKSTVDWVTKDTCNQICDSHEDHQDFQFDALKLVAEEIAGEHDDRMTASQTQKIDDEDHGVDFTKSTEPMKEEEEEEEEETGPKPQVITNDLLSLHEKVVQLLCQCTCPTQFPMVRIGDGKYKVGDKLIIFVRILRRHIMVRVGGGWQELSEFLRQKDPCRTKGNQHLSSVNFNNANNNQCHLDTLLAKTRLASNSAVPKSCHMGSSHHLNKSHNQTHQTNSQLYRSSNGQRLISGSVSMSWLSNN